MELRMYDLLISLLSVIYPASMMRLTHNTSCTSLSALEQQQPCGSTATIYPPIQPRRLAAAEQLEDQLLLHLQNVSIFNSKDVDLAGLGITSVSITNGNPWQPRATSFGTASTNGFTSSDTSSAPLSPISSPGLNKANFQSGQRAFVRNPAHPNHLRNARDQQSFHANRRSNNHGASPAEQTMRTIHIRGSGEEYHPGMRALPYWLKKLRLHKYAPLFQDMTYRQLLAIDSTALEKMRVTNGARKKIAQSIEKLHERPALLKSIDEKLKNGTQCVRCAICSIRQLLWCPFIRYDGGSRKTSSEIIDAFHVPTQMISNDNLPALMFRVIETLNQMIFPLRKQLLDLEDEYQLTMFHIFESVMKNESFTQNQQRRAFSMKRNARNFANPEDIRRHRMGMVSSSQCEGCHHAEVVNRERLMEFQDRRVRQAREARGPITELIAPPQNARLEFNVPPASPSQRIQKRPALVEDEEWLATSTGSPKITNAPIASFSPVILDNSVLESIILPQHQPGHFWNNVNTIWGDEKPSTSYIFPEYRNPEHKPQQSSSSSMTMMMEAASEEFDQPSFNFLRMLSDEVPPKTPSLNDFNFSDSITSSSKKANSTGSGYSSSDSEVSIITSPRASSVSTEDVLPKTLYGINQILCPSTAFTFHYM
uniref:SAM domain-containing protein n=2 Tax=Caenorhabditis japonica TaxID=281687 RepID=A0A8R1DGZ0_CAEJA